MPYYFMRDTPLQALEQLMMSQPGQKPRGGGIYRSPFHYTPKDVACEYCQNYVRITGFYAAGRRIMPRRRRRMALIRALWKRYREFR